MSVNTLGRRFREELNTTPHRWLTEQRKAHVISLLADTDMPFQEIADVCGFAAPSYLWDFCKKHLKATPAEIREIARCARPVRHPFRFRSEGLTVRSRLADNPNMAVKIQNARFPAPR